MTFSLSGLLRVRGTQERVAAEELARATHDRVHAETASERALSDLSALDGVVDERMNLLALAVARAAGRSALSELQMLVELRRDEEVRAQAVHIETRRDLRGLERLESTHRSATAKARLDAEQLALDEIAIVRAARRTGSAA
ncbi:hypothetical protein [Microbacterium sp.]|uniref:hypothetical protein n=1 Tax=Microbacterium sp. TaxID=51671 RepID=UPI003F6E771F